LNSRFSELQGFYIYRLKRLISYGSWFRLEPKTELAKMARVMVDIPPSMDRLWKLGIMKSTLEVPDVLRRRLRELVPEIVSESARVITRRGAIVPTNEILAWDIQELGLNEFRLSLNAEHPLLQALFEKLDPSSSAIVSQYMKQVELSLPVYEISSVYTVIRCQQIRRIQKII